MSVPKPSEFKVSVFEPPYALYLETGGMKNRSTELWELGERLGFDADEARRIYDYLEPEGLVRAETDGGRIGISGTGLAEIEQLLRG